MSKATFPSARVTVRFNLEDEATIIWLAKRWAGGENYLNIARSVGTQWSYLCNKFNWYMAAYANFPWRRDHFKTTEEYKQRVISIIICKKHEPFVPGARMR